MGCSQKENLWPPAGTSPARNGADSISPRRRLQAHLAREAASSHERRVPSAADGRTPQSAYGRMERRKAAADWAEGLTGVALPVAADTTFRGALRDGILLCRILNTLRPGAIPKASIP